MAVYVDTLVNYGGSATFRWTHSCHMWADTIEELHAFAASIGMRRAWFQPPKDHGVRLPHYDLNANRRRIAVLKGAIELDRTQAVNKWIELGFMKPRPMVAKGGEPKDNAKLWEKLDAVADEVKRVEKGGEA